MNPLTLTTELDAVNIILSHIQRQPVNTLTGPSSSDGARAYATLREVTRELLTRGWEFNQDRNVTLVRDSNDEIPLSTNVVRVSIPRTKYSDIRPIQRGNKMYDVQNQVYTFSRDLEAELVTKLLDWDLIPESARRYITIRAARMFAKRTKVNATTHSLTQEDEFGAWLTFSGEYESDRDINIGMAPDMIELLNRN